MSSLFHDKTYQLEARQFVGKNSCIKGQPNLTRAMFSQWVNETYYIKISDETARSWLAKLGFKRIHHQKGVYFDGHDRDDVVLYREVFESNGRTGQKITDSVRKHTRTGGGREIVDTCGA